ncbi:MAG: CopG family ribbon-helix-helix protein [Hyphomicrobiales bacterium]|nr:CopG family ribbon-helix-helix protein [Hyphomicrobiales bacterium]
MTSTTLTIRVDESDMARLEELARSTGRSSSLLAAEAIAEYLAVNEWQVARIRSAMESLDRGEGIEHDAVRKWVQSWGTENELKPPSAS